MATFMGLTSRTNFQQADASQPLPFQDSTFDAIICMDAMNHFYDRVRLYQEWYRILRPGGRILFTDPITVTGMLLRDEILIRSGSMGLFVFTPPGTNERFIAAAHFEQPQVEDVTDNIVLVSGNWHAARARHEAELIEVEGATAYDSFQTFLSIVHLLSSERRLSRLLFVARKPV
jgi:SAM-dependent methyltransferase